MRMNCRRQPVSRRRSSECPQGLMAGEPEHDGGETPPRLVLPQEHVDQVGERACLFHARKNMLLLQLLVIILHEGADYAGRFGKRRRLAVPALPEPPDPFLVDQQHPPEHPVLAHEVFGR